MLIKNISPEQRPRERLREKGPDSLSDAELVAILLQSGSKGENAIELSNRLISDLGIQGIKSQSLNELTKIKGIGMAKASKLIAAFELSKRADSGRVLGKSIRKSSDVADYCANKLKDLKRECFVMLMLDSKNKVIKEEVISLGTLNASLVHPREVFKPAIKESSSSIILVHNHPSGDPTPSNEDKAVTKMLFSAGKLLDINVLDHIIIGKEGHWSFADEKII